MLLAEQPKIHLALGLHYHQPVGNWDHVVEDAYQHSYLPFLEVLERHPRIPFTLHYDGHLLSWLSDRHPEFIERLRALVSSGQVELLGGAHYEPMLAIIPPEDQHGQMRLLAETVRRLTGYEPAGVSLAGRVWEPQLVRPIAAAGMRYCVLDDQPFRAVGMRDDDLFGYYQTEELGAGLSVFPNNAALRAMLPFQAPERVLAYLRENATTDGARLAVHMDDGAKLGGWPGTYQAVYVEGWLDRFFALLEQHREWIVPVTLGGYRETHRPWGRVYLPTGSFTEMQGWALPPEQASSLEALRGSAPAGTVDFLHAGYWRHFLVRYPESNTMHKKMLRVAAGVHSLARERGAGARTAVGATEGGLAERGSAPWQDELAAAREALWRGQSHDPFWHGIFGGIYLNHLRAANYAALLQAEGLCDRLRHGEASFSELEIVDFDLDGSVEALVSTREQNLYVTPVYGGGLFEHDLKRARVNLLDTLARRPEAYHARIAEALPAPEPGKGPLAALGERALTKESGLERFLHYDWYRRLSLLDHFLHPDTRLETFYNVSYGEQGDFVNQPYELSTRELPDGVELTLTREGHVWVGSEFWPVRVTKSLRVPREGAGYEVDYELENLWERPVELWFGTEFNFNVRSGSGQRGGYYSASGRHIEPAHPAARAEDEQISEIGLREESLGVDVHLSWSEVATLWRFPVETVSRSEGGFERVYQSSVVFPNWRIALPESGRWRCKLAVQVRQQEAEE